MAMLCGCGPNAAQQSRQQFKEAIAAMKICTQDATYQEFRDKRLAVDTCYTANQSALAGQSNSIASLSETMRATDVLWNLQIQMQADFPNYYPDDSQKFENVNAMKIIKEVSGFTWPQLKEEHDFPHNYVVHGLTAISSQCDDLLK